MLLSRSNSNKRDQEHCRKSGHFLLSSWWEQTCHLDTAQLLIFTKSLYYKQNNKIFTKSKVSLFFSFVQYFSRCGIFIALPPLFIYYLLYLSVHSVYVFLSSSFVYCLLFSHLVVLLHNWMVQVTIQWQ